MPRVYSEEELDMIADYQGEEVNVREEEDEDSTPVTWEAVQAFWNAQMAMRDRQYEAALKASKVQCADCLCERKDVVSDRLYVREDAVCCGEVA